MTSPGSRSSRRTTLGTTDDIGPLGIPYVEVGQLVQALGVCIVQREEYTEEEVIAALRSEDFDEVAFWEYVAPLVDRLTDELSELLPDLYEEVPDGNDSTSGSA
jgi:hypothetical protein